MCLITEESNSPTTLTVAIKNLNTRYFKTAVNINYVQILKSKL